MDTFHHSPLNTESVPDAPLLSQLESAVIKLYQQDPQLVGAILAHVSKLGISAAAADQLSHKISQLLGTSPAPHDAHGAAVAGTSSMAGMNSTQWTSKTTDLVVAERGMRHVKSESAVSQLPNAPSGNIQSLLAYIAPLIHSPGMECFFLNPNRYRTDFEEICKIGHGAFGSVFKVKHKIDSLEYAVKKVRLTFKSEHDRDRVMTKVLREVKSLAQLDHPNIVRYHQAWIERSTPKAAAANFCRVNPRRALLAPVPSSSPSAASSPALHSTPHMHRGLSELGEEEEEEEEDSLGDGSGNSSDDESDGELSSSDSSSGTQSSATYSPPEKEDESGVFAARLRRSGQKKDLRGTAINYSRDFGSFAESQEGGGSGDSSSSSSGTDSVSSSSSGDEDESAEDGFTLDSGSGFDPDAYRKKLLGAGRVPLSRASFGSDILDQADSFATRSEQSWWSSSRSPTTTSPARVLSNSNSEGEEENKEQGDESKPSSQPLSGTGRSPIHARVVSFDDWSSQPTSPTKPHVTVIGADPRSLLVPTITSPGQTSPCSLTLSPSEFDADSPLTSPNNPAPPSLPAALKGSDAQPSSGLALIKLEPVGSDAPAPELSPPSGHAPSGGSPSDKLPLPKVEEPSQTTSKFPEHKLPKIESPSTSSNLGSPPLPPRSKPKPLEPSSPKKHNEMIGQIMLQAFGPGDSLEFHLFIQMQICTPHTLEDWLWAPSRTTPPRSPGVPIPPVNIEEVRRVWRQIIDGLSHVHEKGIVHRDIKPSNIFLSRDGTIKIGDFGLAKCIREECDGEGDSKSAGGLSAFSSRASLSSVGLMSPSHSSFSRHTRGVGTPSYASPEQLQTHTYGCEADIFSAGLILFEMCHPFDTKSERAHILGNVRRGITPEYFQQLYPSEDAMIRRCCSPDPTKRPSAKEILESALYSSPTMTVEELQKQLRAKDDEIKKLRERIALLEKEREVSSAPPRPPPVAVAGTSSAPM